MSIIKGIDIGKRAIMAQTEAIKVTGQNITNVNTPGYSRQKLELRTVIYSPNDSITLLEARRVRDEFIDRHIQTENQALGEWEMKSQLYGQIENIFLEPSEYSLNSILAEFWNNWEDLANSPESMSPRSVIVQRGIMLAQAMNRLDAQLKDLQKTADSYIEDRVVQINDMANQIAHINTKIVMTEASEKEASELRDARDLLVEQMSKMVNTAVVERETGSISLLIGGRAIVDDAKVTPLSVTRDALRTVVWSDDDASVNITSGEVAGLVSIRDDSIPEILTQMDELAFMLVDEVNAIHSTGYGLDGSTGVDFFTGTTAFDIKVNDEIANGVNKLAASGTGEPGDNSIALAIADLANQNIAPGNTTVGTFYSDIVNTLGTQSQSASMMRENAEMLATYLEEQKESVSGISLDEETADLVRFQHAYQSAAQYISVVDELIETLIDIV